jgi:hypothetical protein
MARRRGSRASRSSRPGLWAEPRASAEDLDGPVPWEDEDWLDVDEDDPAGPGPPLTSFLPGAPALILPEEWLKRYGVLAGFGVAQDGHLRFSRTQVGLLDALLASQPEATCDEVFARARDELRRFDGIAAVDPPPGFAGELRPYQREGVGWLHFLRRFRFGGCLADDMGLGKTIMVLALLESRREQRERPGPSLVIVPRSLVFNWKQEAARFTPRLRVLDHTGVDRARRTDHFDGHDLVITTYGTLRRDAALFRDVRFDYVILDEAQAVKNPDTDAAKAARLLQGDHRLALSGTPVENHLGELWSLFEFINPGMLGAASAFRGEGALARNPDEHTRRLLARAPRPFILRRTKDQVARDLPPKVEQTLYCELELPQRALYDELREHYRRSLLDRIARDGIDRAKIQILEALLRLRQAACHPGLLDRARIAEPSAKIDLLLPRLAEVLDEGHKALVFSQFTSLLAIVRERLDREWVPGRPHARPGHRGPAVPAGSRLQALPRQLAGRGPRAQPHRRRVRVPVGPVVEPGRGGTGHRPEPPHLPDPAGLRLPAHRP